MIDSLTVAWKELREVLGDRASRRGVQIQAAIAVAMLGVVMPMTTPQLWLAQSPATVLFFLAFPAIISVAIGADAFAGERERKTLETLLATPLGDRSIVAGKAVVAIAAAVVASALATALAWITVNLSARPAVPFTPGALVWVGTLGGGLACSTLGTALAIALSMRVPVARSVQQMVSLLFIVPIVAGSIALARLGVALTWRNVLALELAVFLAGAAGLAAAGALFHRDRLLAKR